MVKPPNDYLAEYITIPVCEIHNRQKVWLHISGTTDAWWCQECYAEEDKDWEEYMGEDGKPRVIEDEEMIND